MGEKAFIILTPGFPENETESTCLPMQQTFVQSLKRQYPDIHLLILSFQYPFISDRYKWHEAEVISFGGKNRGGLVRLLTWRKVNKTLADLRLKHQIIGILSFWCGECSLINKKFSARHHIPHYFWMMGQDAKKDNTYIQRIKPAAGELIALSDFLQAEFQKNHQLLPAHVISPGVAINRARTNDDRSIDILGAGSLVPLKRFDVFIDIIHEIKKDFPRIRSLICGKGTEEKNLQRAILSAGLNDEVVLTGEIPHQWLIRTMQKCRVFLHPSSYEGFSGVCLEALQAGAQVISFCKPMKENIKNWHVVASKEEMIEKAKSILQSADPCFEPVIYKSIDNTVKEIMQLFGY